MARANERNIEDIIYLAVYAQKLACERQSQDAYKATENRLFAYPVICDKIEDEYEQLDYIKKYGAPQISSSVIRHQRSGVRLTPEQITNVLEQDLSASIADNEYEVQMINKAVAQIVGEPYADIISYKYFDGLKDDDIAARMCCDASTVRRNKSKLVRKIAVYLYGATAIKYV